MVVEMSVDMIYTLVNSHRPGESPMFDGNYIIFKPRKMAGSMLISWRVYRLYGIEGRTKLDGLLPYL